MSTFASLPKWYRLSKQKRLDAWHEGIAKGRITLVNHLDKNEVDDKVLNSYLESEEKGIWRDFDPKSIQPNPDFDIIKAEYKKDWDEHKQKMTITTKTFTVTEIK